MSTFQIAMLLVLVIGIGSGIALLIWGIEKLREHESEKY